MGLRFFNLFDCLKDSTRSGRMLRDYTQDLDAILIAKPPRLCVEQLQMYQDYIAKPLMKASDKEHDVGSADLDEAEDCFGKR